jgi:hypothetical protein
MHGNSMAFHPSQKLTRSYGCYMAKMLLMCIKQKDIQLMQKEIHWNFIHHKDLILKALLHGKILIDVKNY